ncbi:DNA-3-methyladenine glycosylase I [Haloferula luteola]|uniref:DNA-3-methyladenine glycosylase I n=1 Tax=Haloferula luteola TaxID=595692 RepID=A0A840V1L9_9BACT|nr:DNA-3-methyladenine glycosylase I [Haloferula luteola]MBB5351293.1 DNA-3-methyladenine glycosylase I [Haloferula luteola]
MTRCLWVPEDKPLYVDYHDMEWGVASRDPRHLFEMICLEGAQAGLSWWTVLQKRARYREVFHHFEVSKVAEMSDSELEGLLEDPGIIRHRGKVMAFRQNARAWLELDDPVEWIWSFVGGETVVKRPRTMAEVVATSAESDAMSKAMRKAGFNFVGSTTLYAFMQAVGMVDEHSVDCFRSR